MRHAKRLIALIGLGFGLPVAADTALNDPFGRYEMTLVGEWSPAAVEDAGLWFQYGDLPLYLTALVVDEPVPEAAVDVGLRNLGIAPDSLEDVSRTNWNRWTMVNLRTQGGDGITVLAQPREDWTLLVVGRGRGDLFDNPPQDVMASLESVRFAGGATLPQTIPEFEDFVTDAMASGPPGLSIALAGPFELAYARGFGLADGPGNRPATPETVYQWGSINKIVTATAILQLVEQGRLDLDTPISEYLAFVPAEPPTTARHLLTHSSGLPEDPDAIFRLLRRDGETAADMNADLRAYFAAHPDRMFPPGSMSAYVNPNYILLGELVAVQSGVAYEDYVRSSILRPLGLDATEFGLTNEAMRAAAAASAIPADQRTSVEVLIDAAQGAGRGATFFRETDGVYAWLNPFVIDQAGAGGLVGPATELARVGQMILNGGTLEGARILGRDTVAEFLSPQAAREGGVLEIGLAWHFGGDAPHVFVEHDGGGPGIQAKLRLYVDDGLAVALMANGAGIDRDEVADAAAHVFFAAAAR